MAQLIAVLLPLLLLAFWAWMFYDVTSQRDLPACFITLTAGRDPRLDWTIAFVLLNIVAACVYFVNVYRYRH